MPSKLRDGDYWSDLAEEARIQAEQMVTPEAKDELLAISARYQRLALHARKRRSRKAPRGQ